MRKTNKTQAYSTPRAGARAQTGGAVGLQVRFIVFPLVFLHLWYADALIGLEINIRLDLTSNDICKLIPEEI